MSIADERVVAKTLIWMQPYLYMYLHVVAFDYAHTRTYVHTQLVCRLWLEFYEVTLFIVKYSDHCGVCG